MAQQTRRTFLGGAAFAVAGGAGLLASRRFAFAEPLGLPIGFQGYDARFLLTKDWLGGWKQLRDMGFQSVDLVSFKGYGYEKSDLGKMSGKEVRQTLDSVGMLAENCQFYYAELQENFKETMAYSRDLGLKYIICAPASGHRATADDWKWQAEQLNELGKRVQAEGFQLGYHNHDLEFMPVGDAVPYDVLMANTDPKLVRFQIDVGNLTFAGADALAYLQKYSDRYFSMHAKDYLPGKTSVPVGQGILDWNKIFTLAKKARIVNYFAEVAAYGVGTLHGVPASAWPSDSLDQLRASCKFLRELTI
jgi:sugar phosphate isomerase/epimerase